MNKSKNNYNLTKEDLDFLMELQHEMLTQDHVSQAAPRFWVVAGTKREYVGEEYGEGEELVCYDGKLADGLEEAIKYFKEEVLPEDDDDFEYVLEKEEAKSFDSWRFAKIDKNCDKNAVDYYEDEEIIVERDFIRNIEELIEALEEGGIIDEGEYDTAYYCKKHHIYPDTMFLTNRSCKEHIKANYYHYSSDAHSYAMTAWRSPEVEKLWNILDKIDWKGIKENAYGKENARTVEKCSRSSKQG